MLAQVTVLSSDAAELERDEVVGLVCALRGIEGRRPVLWQAQRSQWRDGRPPRTAPREESLCAACLPQVSRMVKEMHRVLKPGGVYVVISHGVPTSRLGYLSGSWLEWSVEHQPIRE